MKQKIFYVQITSFSKKHWYYGQVDVIYQITIDEDYPNLYFLVNPPDQVYKSDIGTYRQWGIRRSDCKIVSQPMVRRVRIIRKL